MDTVLGWVSRGRSLSLNAVDLSIGLANVAVGPAVSMAADAVQSGETLARRATDDVLRQLPDEGEGLRTSVSELTESGRRTRARATDGVARTVVKQALSNPVAQSMIEAAVDELVEEVVSSTVPTMAELVANEIGVTRIDAAVRGSVERVLPQALERTLTSDVFRAASYPARTAWSIVRPSEEKAAGSGSDAAEPDEAAPGQAAATAGAKVRTPGKVSGKVSGKSSGRRVPGKSRTQTTSGSASVGSPGRSRESGKPRPAARTRGAAGTTDEVDAPAGPT
jgi:hypothetical protein